MTVNSSGIITIENDRGFGKRIHYFAKDFQPRFFGLNFSDPDFAPSSIIRARRYFPLLFHATATPAMSDNTTKECTIRTRKFMSNRLLQRKQMVRFGLTIICIIRFILL